MATLASLGATSVAPRAAAPRRVANARGVARAPPSRGVARCAKRGESRGDRALARAWDARDGRRARGGERGDAAAARAHAAGARAFEARRHRGSGVAHAAAGAVDGGDASGSTPVRHSRGPIPPVASVVVLERAVVPNFFARRSISRRDHRINLSPAD
jgi:hypothetical protein